MALNNFSSKTGAAPAAPDVFFALGEAFGGLAACVPDAGFAGLPVDVCPLGTFLSSLPWPVDVVCDCKMLLVKNAAKTRMAGPRIRKVICCITPSSQGQNLRRNIIRFTPATWHGSRKTSPLIPMMAL